MLNVKVSRASPKINGFLIYHISCISIHLLHRSPSTHKMSPWVKSFFLDFMPRVLCMTRPEYHPRYAFDGDFTTNNEQDYGMNFGAGYVHYM